MKYYKNYLCLCLLILTFSLVGCASKPNVVETTTIKTDSPGPVITFSKLTISKDTDITWKAIGEATNKDTVKHTYTATITYYDANKNIITTGDASLTDVGAGETKTFIDKVDKDISKSTYKIQINIIGD